MAMQGEVKFPGVGQVGRGEMRGKSGVKPAVAVVEMVPQAGLPQGEGELVWSCGNTRLVFPGCRVKRMALRRGLRGLVWRMEIVDRRWRWKFAKVSGRYNVRDAAGKLLRWTEKTPRELAALCRQAMGETCWDVGSLPNGLRPEVDWVQANAARELEQLCAALGCKVGLGLDNRAKVYRAGVGMNLPESDAVFEDGLTLAATTWPEKVVLWGGANLYQARWKLRAVGLDEDGEIRALEDLSYRPSAGWGNVEPGEFSTLEGENKRRLAKLSVWRWYQVTGLADGTLNVPGGPRLQRVEQALPLRNERLENYRDERDGQRRGHRARVFGKFYAQQGKRDNTEQGAVYEWAWRLDGARGLVMFGQPVFQVEGERLQEAELFLECVFQVKQAETGAVQRYQRETRLQEAG